jgi:hypothetical protein
MLCLIQIIDDEKYHKKLIGQELYQKVIKKEKLHNLGDFFQLLQRFCNFS